MNRFKKKMAAVGFAGAVVMGSVLVASPAQAAVPNGWGFSTPSQVMCVAKTALKEAAVAAEGKKMLSSSTRCVKSIRKGMAYYDTRLWWN
ncbi:hypothetical protein SAMN04487788_2869 [Microbacterium testaceum StLB037]|uniref:Uncharacterized protein n=1 Tax=Microbacterium testaceum (strain StLB037) TaxID=979556 RepID=A0A1H0QIV2_MICTS|nr:MULTISPECIES: hypothetical protein [Microbacterium]MCY1718553.1 hypothetical protein [Microbacterium sp. SL62]MCY1718643.1 hypothetical protein [Microbacterium sp. SL62]SDP16679.1 hypothetical protein SAMN04487788_2323 [Microbacterium testaceum StLB037]SDP29840.1 hypothetical protein SAMN04487788_2869 [Microbacterium testaceum StLB037]